MDERASSRPSSSPWRHVVVPLAYVATAMVGLQFRSYGLPVTPMWPPAGIAFAATFAWGLGAVPGVFVGAAIVNVLVAPWPTGPTALALALVLGLGNTAAAVSAAGIARQLRFDPRMTHLRDVAALTIAGAVGAMSAALVGSVALATLHRLDPSTTSHVARVWWLGDHLGIVTFGPLLLARHRGRALGPAALPMAVMLLVTTLVVIDPLRVRDVVDASWLTLLPLIWLGLRAGPEFIPLGLIVMEICFLAGTEAGLGPLAGSHRADPYVALAVFLVLAAGTAQAAGTFAWRLRESLDDARRGSTHFMNLIDNFPAGAVFAARDGSVRINQAAAQLTGAALNSTLTWPDWVDAVFVDPAAFRSLPLPTPGHVVRGVFDVRGARGVRTALVAGTRHEDGELWLLADDTLRQEREDELRRAKEAAEAGLRSRSEFLATMSHEVRTPLNGVIGLAQALRHTRLDAHQRAWLDALELSAHSLLSLLSDILDVSRFDAGQVRAHPGPMRPSQPADDVLQMLQPEAAERGLYLTLESEPLPESVLTDVGLVRQVLLNLVGNALKFTPTGGVTVRVEHAADRLRYHIIDTGIGLPPELGDRVFDPFVRGDPSSTTAHPGSGLGLAISRRFARLLDGDVTFASTPPGTTFVLEVSAPISADAPPTTAPVTPSPPGRVLVADDNAVNRTVIRALLGQLGVETEVVDDGDAAIDAASRGTWDLILMDCRMPGLDGFDATRALRRQGVTTPIVALSASNLASDREACAEAGMDDYLSKPVTLHALRQIVARWVREPSSP